MTLRLVPTPPFDPGATRRQSADESDPTHQEFHGESTHRIDTVETSEGRLLWSARHLATALGYARDDIIGTSIRTDWSAEFEADRDFVVVHGDDLAPFKEIGVVGKNAPSALFLTESGVHLVALLSRQPASRALRRWLADEVLPSLRRTGSYGAVDVRALREARLAAIELRRAGDKASAARLLRRAHGLGDEPKAAPAAPAASLDGFDVGELVDWLRRTFGIGHRITTADIADRTADPQLRRILVDLGAWDSVHNEVNRRSLGRRLANAARRGGALTAVPRASRDQSCVFRLAS